ncbi:hypothetical protein [Streptomyces rubellomurinus]|uniref:PPE family domain-containing protein n=1 Tax=Streptomyces rubellomurinus (strain ATCC 31215) TaxID=359131 RepID=A0A0F2TDC7_STRR3|nr:hypothetical protein [Streptomyces rubellomurinus]KJS61169.1 hypothetical protein VM95_16425 [Streptomyces rubellomurinus]
MVSFKDLHEADFAAINDAAEAWSGVAKALTSLDGRVTKDLTSTAQRAGWKGKAADEATKALQGIDSDFKQASTVATSLASIMKAAAEDFAAARRDLDKALLDATGDITVAADGTVKWTVPKESRNDPDAEPTIRAKAQTIADSIKKAVEKATAADQKATTALQADIGTSTTSFNPNPHGGGAVAAANQAKDLMSKGGSLSDPELKQLQDLMAANAGNKDFATTLLNGLNFGGKTGPDALLEYSKVYGDLAHGNHNAKGYQDVYGNLSTVFATATRDGGMGKDWEDGLLKAARRPGGSAAGWNDNYPALTSLMGAGGKFDKAFLVKVGDDLVDFERTSKTKGEDLWGPNWSLNAGAGDPLGPLMKQMRSDPAAAAEFLDPSRNGNLGYLLKDRAWPNADLEGTWSPDELRDSSHGLFSQVLEAGATGRDPNGSQPPVRPHDATMNRIMDSALSTLGGDTAGNENSLAAPLRRPLANMIAEYAADTHDLLGKDLPGPSHPGGLNATREQLLRVIRGTAEDPEAYALIHMAESQEVARRTAEFGPEAFRAQYGRPDPKLEGFALEASKALGALDAVQADTIMDHKADQQFRNNWKAKMDYHYWGTAANMLKVPGADWIPLGDVAQRIVDVATSDWANKANSALDTQAQVNISKLYSMGEPQVAVMLQERAKQLGIPDAEITADGSVVKQLASRTTDHYQTSIASAYHAALGNG